MEIKERTKKDFIILDINGQIDMQTSPALREVLKQKLDNKGPKLLVNFSKVQFIDSSGIATLVEALKNSRSKKGILRLFGLSHSVKSVFQLAQLDKVFEVFNSENQAIEEEV